MATTSFRFEMNPNSEEPLSEIACPLCGEWLTVHMPDPVLPDRLLGTCARCTSWYVMELAEGMMTLVATSPSRRARTQPQPPPEEAPSGHESNSARTG